MNSTWQALIGNLAIVGLAISLWAHLLPWVRKTWPEMERVAFGITLGCGAIASMMVSVELRPGLFMDLRASLLSIAGLFGGPVAAVIAAGVAILYRISVGGAGVYVGICTIGLAAFIGSVAHLIVRRHHQPGYLDATFTAVAVVISTWGMLAWSPIFAAAHAVKILGLQVTFLNFLATEVCGFVLIQMRKNEIERIILRAAFSQAPDYLYVKDRESRFVVANENTAQHNNIPSAEDLIGLNDFHLMPAPHAEELYFREQEIMRTGVPLTNFIETIGERSYLTTKVPLRDPYGQIIGLAGVTRDITKRERLERELRDSKNMLSHALAGMSDGFAMYDSKGYLVFCNEQYRESFPLSADARVVGAHISDILRRAVEVGERADFGRTLDAEGIAKAAATLHKNKDEEVELANGQWRSIRTRLANDGSAMVVVSDITAMKHAEIALRISAEQLKSLAQTDGLTGVHNRRAFDEALALEISRSLRSNKPVSLLMVDVDHFKAYNDTYGHPAGDQCLKVVGASLQQSAKRKTDFVARYGGEEFVILLPDTEENGARRIAEEFMKCLRRNELPHSASQFGHVTASVGLATLGGHGRWRSDANTLLERADSALYQAKLTGRDRIETWQALDDGADLRDVG